MLKSKEGEVCYFILGIKSGKRKALADNVTLQKSEKKRSCRFLGEEWLRQRERQVQRPKGRTVCLKNRKKASGARRE